MNHLNFFARICNNKFTKPELLERYKFSNVTYPCFVLRRIINKRLIYMKWNASFCFEGSEYLSYMSFMGSAMKYFYVICTSSSYVKCFPPTIFLRCSIDQADCGERVGLVRCEEPVCILKARRRRTKCTQTYVLMQGCKYGVTRVTSSHANRATEKTILYSHSSTCGLS